MDKLRVLLVDDHAILREGLAALINDQPDMEVVGLAEDGHTALLQIPVCLPEIVIMDISMPGINGIQTTIQIQQMHPDIQILVLSRHSEPGYIRQLLQLGARGYVLKQAATEELITALRAIKEGGIYLDTTLTNRFARQFVGTAQATEQALDLSQREAAVVRLTAYGYSNKEIATQLGISVKTVDTYKMRAMEKLGLHSRVALVRYAIERGWFEQPE